MFESLKFNPFDNISPIAPIKPMSIPIIWFFNGLDLNRKVPIIKANKGTKEFSIPLKELATLVCAKVNKNAGITFQITPKRIKN